MRAHGQGPGHARVQLSMASLLATLVLDDEAMVAVAQRGEGPLVFEAALKLVRSWLQRQGRRRARAATEPVPALPRPACCVCPRAHAQLTHVLDGLRLSLALPGGTILADGLTQADVAAAMQELRRGGGSSDADAATPLMQAAARRLSQEAALAASSGPEAAAARRLSTDAASAAAARRLSADASAAAAALSEAGQARRSSIAGALEPPERLDVAAAVSLAEACAAAMWGTAHSTLEGEPPQLRPDHVAQLGRLALDWCVPAGAGEARRGGARSASTRPTRWCCQEAPRAPPRAARSLVVSELDLGRVCHCVVAALASVAAHEVGAAFIMGGAGCAHGDSAVRAVLALLEVEDEAGLSHAAHIRAAASTCLAFLAGHPLGARGDDCLVGPHRERLLAAGALAGLLRAALASAADTDACAAVVQQTAAVGIMYCTTMVGPAARGRLTRGRQLAARARALARRPPLTAAARAQAGAVAPADLTMFAALLASNTNAAMVAYLLAGFWLLLKHPSNRAVLGSAFAHNPAASALAQGLMQKLQDTVELADVSDAVS